MNKQKKLFPAYTAPLSVLTLDASNAEAFFLSTSQFMSCEMPEYIEFEGILNFVKEKVGDKTFEECCKENPDNLHNVSLNVLANKDGHYAVRPLTLANPYLYYFIVREICGEGAWQNVKKCFEKYHTKHITACAIPVIPKEGEAFHKATTILNWWNNLEQRTLELSLEYKYMFITDITNCYGTVNPQTIEWALTLKDTEFATDENKQMARNIIRYLAALQQGRNIGLPQGGVVFNLISEIILGYSDLLLHNEIQKYFKEEKIKNEPYKIIRYCDDYRIFCNNMKVLQKISYILQEVLERLNFRMNSQKTKISTSIVTDSIKPDKLWYIENTPIFRGKNCQFGGIQKTLMYILLFGRKFPNGGQLKTMLSNLSKNIADRKSIVENVRAMCAVAVQIAAENVNVSHYALKIVSQLVEKLDDKVRHDILDKVVTKLINRPNSKYDQLWLQNITCADDRKRKKLPYEYDFPLCQLVDGKDVELWDNSWLLDEFTDGFPYSSIVDELKLPAIPSAITFREIRGYNEWLDGLEEGDSDLPRAEDMETLELLTDEIFEQKGEPIMTFPTIFKKRKNC